MFDQCRFRRKIRPEENRGGQFPVSRRIPNLERKVFGRVRLPPLAGSSRSLARAASVAIFRPKTGQCIFQNAEYFRWPRNADILYPSGETFQLLTPDTPSKSIAPLGIFRGMDFTQLSFPMFSTKLEESGKESKSFRLFFIFCSWFNLFRSRSLFAILMGPVTSATIEFSCNNFLQSSTNFLFSLSRGFNFLYITQVIFISRNFLNHSF